MVNKCIINIQKCYFLDNQLQLYNSKNKLKQSKKNLQHSIKKKFGSDFVFKFK